MRTSTRIVPIAVADSGQAHRQSLETGLRRTRLRIMYEKSLSRGENSALGETATLGRLDQMHAKGEVETFVRSLARYSEQALLILSGRTDISAESTKICPALIFERLWKELGIAKVFQGLLSERFFTFEVERTAVTGVGPWWAAVTGVGPW